MRFVLFCSSRLSVPDVIKKILEKDQIECCVLEGDIIHEIEKVTKDNGIPVIRYESFREKIAEHSLSECDYGISYLFHKIMKNDVIKFFNDKIINFHPSLVQDHKGVASYCYCLYNQFDRWGCTAHFLTEGIDDGDIILQNHFDVPKEISAYAFEKLQHKYLIELVDDVLKIVHSGNIPRQKQNLDHRIYYGQKDLDRDKIVTINDNTNEIDKKIRAFWYPPFHGAHILIDGRKYSLVNDDLLKEIAKYYEG